MKKFEYKIYSKKPTGAFSDKVNVDEIQEAINKFGAEGWELISSATTNVSYGSTGVILFVFKREREDA